LLVPLAYAVLFKLAAFLFRRARLSWRHALVFGLLALGVGAVGALGTRALGAALPALLLALVGVAFQLALGGWYFGPRVTSAQGQPFGFRKGVLLSLAAYAIVFLVGVAAAVLGPAMHNAGPG
jgi:hypothetical protein